MSEEVFCPADAHNLFSLRINFTDGVSRPPFTVAPTDTEGFVTTPGTLSHLTSLEMLLLPVCAASFAQMVESRMFFSANCTNRSHQSLYPLSCDGVNVLPSVKLW